MNPDIPTLVGRRVRLEPLSEAHIEGLVAAAGNDKELYRWSNVPLTHEAAREYVAAALKALEEKQAVPFATIRVADGMVIGSSRFFEIQNWLWPTGHARYGRSAPDVCEIGHTWLSRSAVRTGANLEAKLLMLSHAFEVWRVLRVCFHADARNERSIRALTSLGATREGILRAHRMGVGFMPRNSVRFSILPEDWPAMKDRLKYRLTHHPDALELAGR